jgi:hypothetical protein
MVLSCTLFSGNTLANLDDGLVAYYPFEGNAKDASRNGNDAKEHGDIEYVDGKYGKAAKFDGIHDYIEIKSGMNFSQMTISFYMKTEFHNPATLFQKGETCPDGNPSYNGTAYWIRMQKIYNSDGQGFYIVAIEPNGNFFDDRIAVFGKEQIPIRTLDHYVIVFKDNVFRIYLNGNLMNIYTKFERGGSSDRTTISPSEFSGIHQTEASLKIGASESYCNYNHEYKEYFKGILDEIRFYNRALSES